MAEATAKTVLDKISQGHLECPICCCRFKEPKILDCLHSFCLNCLEEMMNKQKTETEKITCPVCRKVTQVPDGGLQSLSNSFVLSSLVDEFNQQEQVLGKASGPSRRCEECEEGFEAVSRCLDCKENICTKCKEAHQRLKYTKDHRIIPLQDFEISRVLPTDATKTVAPKCREHIEQRLCFHCETCDTLICAMCFATQHRSAEHNVIGITDAMESFRKTVTDILQKFEKSREELASNENSIKHARNRLQTNLAKARCDVSAKAEAEIAKIRNKAKLLTEKVDEIGQERDSEYEKALKQNRVKMERADQIVTAVNDLMRQADDFKLFELKPKVMNNLELQKKLKCEPAQATMAFIGVKCQDVVSDTDLGEILLSEKRLLKETIPVLETQVKVEENQPMQEDVASHTKTQLQLMRHRCAKTGSTSINSGETLYERYISRPLVGLQSRKKKLGYGAAAQYGQGEPYRSIIPENIDQGYPQRPITHPTCPKCQIGFPDIDILQVHMLDCLK